MALSLAPLCCARTGFDEAPSPADGSRSADRVDNFADSGGADVAVLPGFEIVALRSPRRQLTPGQVAVAVSLELRNVAEAPLELIEVALRLEQGGAETTQAFDISGGCATPSMLLGGASRTCDFALDVPTQLGAGEVTVRGQAWARVASGQLVRATDVAAPLLWQVATGAQVSIDRVWSPVVEVYPGEPAVEVRLLIANAGAEAVQVRAAGLSFTRGGASDDASFTVRLAPGATGTVAPATQRTVGLLVDVAGGAAEGEIALDAWVEVGLEGGPTVREEGAAETTRWQLRSRQGLWVTTADDEDDIEGEATLEAAGGAADLSLREALRIAAAATQPLVVRFDSLIFDPAAPSAVLLDPALGGLPPLIRDGTELDGSGALLSFTAQGIALLVASADALVLRGISISGPGKSTCLLVDGASNLRLLNARVTGCACAPGVSGCSRRNSVEVKNSSNVLIEDCRIESSQYVALGLAASTASVQVRGCTLSNGGYDSTMVVSGSGHVLESLAVSPDRDNALALSGASIAVLTDIRAKEVIVQGSSDLRLRQVRANRMAVHSASQRVTVSQVQLAQSETTPLSVASDSNSDVRPPVVTSFDGQHVVGTAPGADGTIEVYAVDGSWRYLVSAEVVDGSWSAVLEDPVERVVATYTAPSGSTSAFSE